MPTRSRNRVVVRLQPCHIPDASARDACRDWLQAAYSRKVPWWPPVRRRVVETSALQPSHSPDSPLRDFVPTIGLQNTYSQLVPGWFQTVEAVSTLLRYTCATGHLGVGVVGAQSVTVRAVTPDHSEGLQYHVLPIDDAEAVVDIMRAAAGLPPLSDEHDDWGG